MIRRLVRKWLGIEEMERRIEARFRSHAGAFNLLHDQVRDTEYFVGHMDKEVCRVIGVIEGPMTPFSKRRYGANWSKKGLGGSRSNAAEELGERHV